jgi:hypothetical protein
MDLDDRAIVAPCEYKRHVRPARAALIGGNNHAKTALGRERERALLLNAKLGPENVHGLELERLGMEGHRG